LNKLMFIEPWELIERDATIAQRSLEREACKEIPPGHPLYGKALTALARRRDRDEVLFEIDGGPLLACVHLTWTGRVEIEGFPLMTSYASLADFQTGAMLEDAAEYRN
ncbi:MAG: hypothetical protein AAGB13_07100, partial [Cyanobacteria bacterium P01_F01_bin.33]